MHIISAFIIFIHVFAFFFFSTQFLPPFLFLFSPHPTPDIPTHTSQIIYQICILPYFNPCSKNHI